LRDRPPRRPIAAGRPSLAFPSGGRGLRALAPALLGASLALACATPIAPAPGSVRGRLVQPAGAPAPPSEPMAVFLEPLDADPPLAVPAPAPVVRPGEHGLAPAALAIAAGGSVRFANDGPIYHRIFSYSEANPFELGTLRRGEEKSVRFARPGVVHLYCSLHPSERAVLFVAPSPYFATFHPPEAYEIPEVPPGRYRLHALGVGLGAKARAVTVRSGETTAVALALAGRTRGAPP
jgi:hypothetical protein